MSYNHDASSPTIGMSYSRSEYQNVYTKEAELVRSAHELALIVCVDTIKDFFRAPPDVPSGTMWIDAVTNDVRSNMFSMSTIFENFDYDASGVSFNAKFEQVKNDTEVIDVPAIKGLLPGDFYTPTSHVFSVPNPIAEMGGVNTGAVIISTDGISCKILARKNFRLLSWASFEFWLRPKCGSKRIACWTPRPQSEEYMSYERHDTYTTNSSQVLPRNSNLYEVDCITFYFTSRGLSDAPFKTAKEASSVVIGSIGVNGIAVPAKPQSESQKTVDRHYSHVFDSLEVEQYFHEKIGFDVFGRGRK